MPQGTDLFNSTQGQFSGYTTLIGGCPPNVDSWFYDGLSSLANVNQISGAVGLNSVGGLQATDLPTTSHRFEMTQKELLDFAVVLNYQTGKNVSNFVVGTYGRETGANFLAAKVVSSSNQLQLVKSESGVETVFAEYPITPLDLERSYWLVFMTVGRALRCEHWDSDPREGGSPMSTVSYTMSEEENSAYSGSTVGVVDWVPSSITARILNIEGCFAFVDQSTDIDMVLAQKHVDIRDFINYRYPARYKTIRELNAFHVAENAYSQVITLTDNPTGGTFSLRFFPSDANPYVPIDLGTFSFNADNQTILNVLNNVLNELPKFSNVKSQPITLVANNFASVVPTMTIEFATDYGDISLLQIDLSNLTGDNPIESFGNYNTVSHIGTFEPSANDANYIRDADPTSTASTVGDLRFENAQKSENWSLYSSGLTPPSPRKFKVDSLAVGKLITQENRRAAVLNFSRAARGSGWSVYMHSAAAPVNCLTIGSPDSVDDLLIEVSFASFPWEGTTPVLDVGSPNGCSIQFTSEKDGLFADQGGDARYDSTAVPFYQNLFYSGSGDSTVDFKANISKFLDSAGELFTFATVTGVRLFLKSTVTSATQSAVAIMAIRCIPITEKKWLSAEINTLEQTVCYPNLDETQDYWSIPPMIGGANLQTTTSDISPIDSQQSIIFQTGLDLSESLNRFMMFAREQEFDNLSRSSWLTAEYAFNKDDCYLKRYKTLRVKSSGTVDVFWDTHPGGVFYDEFSNTEVPVTLCTELDKPSSPFEGQYIQTTDSNKYYRWNGYVWVLSDNPNAVVLNKLSLLEQERNYEFVFKVQSNQMNVEIHELTYAEQEKEVVYISSSATSPEWVSAVGRIGWYAEFADKDTYVSSFNLESSSYALFRTKAIVSETPIEGAQLFTVDSGLKDLFRSFRSLNSDDTLVVDGQKTLSSTGSYSFQSAGTSPLPGIVSNEFEVSEWNHMYIEFDIWVPKVLNTNDLKPKIILRPLEQPPATSGVDIFSGCVPEVPLEITFVPGAWSHYKFDLRGTSAKNGRYVLEILSDGDGNLDYSKHNDKWWIDNVHIYTQTIEWEIRAVKDGSWTPFRNSVNRQYGGLHLSERAIGNHVQLQARALTEDAWVSEYTLIPKYVTLGNLVKPDTSVVVGKAYINAMLLSLDETIGGSSNVIGDMTDRVVALAEMESADFFIGRASTRRDDTGTVVGISKLRATFASAQNHIDDTKIAIGVGVLDWDEY